MIRKGLIAACLLLGACGVRAQVSTFGPDFEGARTLRMRGNVLPTPVNGIGAMELNVERVERPEQPFEYALLVEVRAEDLQIRSGPSLRLEIDGETVVLTRDSAEAAWPRVDPTVQEQARYPAADSVMLRLGRAQEVRVAVHGSGWWEARRLSPANLETLRGFVTMYVPQDSVPA